MGMSRYSNHRPSEAATIEKWRHLSPALKPHEGPRVAQSDPLKPHGRGMNNTHVTIDTEKRFERWLNMDHRPEQHQRHKNEDCQSQERLKSPPVGLARRR